MNYFIILMRGDTKRILEFRKLTLRKPESRITKFSQLILLDLLYFSTHMENIQLPKDGCSLTSQTNEHWLCPLLGGHSSIRNLLSSYAHMVILRTINQINHSKLQRLFEGLGTEEELKREKEMTATLPQLLKQRDLERRES